MDGVGDADGPTWIDDVGDGAARVFMMASGADASAAGGTDGCVSAHKSDCHREQQPTTAPAPPWRRRCLLTIPTIDWRMATSHRRERGQRVADGRRAQRASSRARPEQDLRPPSCSGRRRWSGTRWPVPPANRPPRGGSELMTPPRVGAPAACRGERRQRSASKPARSSAVRTREASAHGVGFSL